MSVSTPNNMPKMSSQQGVILSRLLDSSPGTRTHKAEAIVDGKREVVETTVSTPAVPRYPLAHNVQLRNVDRLAERWAK